MMNFSIIQKSQLEGALRIDAEYYQPNYLRINDQLKKLNIPVKILKDLITSPVVTGTTPKQRVCKEDGTDIKFVKTDVLRDGEIDFDSADCLPADQNKKFSQPKAGDILTTIIGADFPIVGRSALIYADNPIMNINQNIVRIRPNESLLPEYLISFIRSKFGISQLWQQSRQTEQVNLNCREVENILIPIFPTTIQKLFVQLVVNAKNEKDLSIYYYRQAENLLLEELALKDVFFENDLSYVVNFSDIKVASRMDAEYFQPKYQKLIEKIKRQNTKTLGELVSMKKGFEPGSEAYQENGKLFIRVSSVSKLGIEEKEQKYLSGELYQKLRKDYEPKLGDILLTKDATPGIAYVIKEPLEGIISGGILDLKVKDNIESEYLALCISSIVGQWQAQRDAGGSVISHWKPEQIKNLVIPILPAKIQKEITELVKKSHEARKKSKELLEQAKRKVEEMIEKGV